MSNITSNAALTDAQSQNDISRNVRQYRDLDLFFSRKNGTNDITKITDIEAVKRSVRNLVLTNFYEKLTNEIELSFRVEEHKFKKSRRNFYVNPWITPGLKSSIEKKHLYFECIFYNFWINFFFCNKKYQFI